MPSRAGLAAAKAEAMKLQKYADITTGVDFTLVAIKTSGTWGEQTFHPGSDLWKKLGGQIWPKFKLER